MSTLNKKVDTYIDNSADFAKELLEYLRNIIHKTCPDVEEDIKWGTPHYSYKGDHLCMMAGFKNHCSFSLYKAELMKDKAIQDSVKAGKKFGYMDKLKSVSELPKKNILISLIKEAMTLNEQGIKKEVSKSAKSKVLEVPDYFEKELKANTKAKEVFYSKSDSFRKEYIVWISDAKTDETRHKRMDEALEWIADGKGRFWKFKK
ncbi:MAG TPA: YdeI/OmpD-associated family protein [Cyclobacteriaceae bacterium]|nr:YdeI/OmpD-associated family protein [Cyclobacteriaceae bacterium]